MHVGGQHTKFWYDEICSRVSNIVREEGGKKGEKRVKRGGESTELQRIISKTLPKPKIR